MATKTVFIPVISAGSFIIPSDFSRLVSVEAIGGGASYSSGSTGGNGGGAYAKSTSVTGLVPGGTAYYGNIGADQDSWFNASANAVPTISTQGVLAKRGLPGSGATGGAGGQASASVGDVKYSGGAGGTGASGTSRGGGGGAAGPGGAGGDGASGVVGNGSGGGGSGATATAPGTAGLTPTSSSGSNGGASAGQTGGAGTTGSGGAGITGGGGGGAGSAGGNGGAGGTGGAIWTANYTWNGTALVSSSATAGPGGGSGAGSGIGGSAGSNESSPYGGGVGGGTNNNAIGGAGIIVFTYTPLPTGFYIGGGITISGNTTINLISATPSVTVVSTSSISASNGTSSYTLPSTVKAGDLIVLFAGTGDASISTDPGVTGPTGYTQILSDYFSSAATVDADHSSWWYKIATVTDANATLSYTSPDGGANYRESSLYILRSSNGPVSSVSAGSVNYYGDKGVSSATLPPTQTITTPSSAGAYLVFAHSKRSSGAASPNQFTIGAVNTIAMNSGAYTQFGYTNAANLSISVSATQSGGNYSELSSFYLSIS